MSEITVIGLDLAKHVFQVHGADPDGRPVLRKRLRRGQVLEFFASLSPCLIGMEACAGSHYWGRELQALGHEVRLIPPQYVKPYVKTNKNDAIDAEAISEALTRPTMRFTAVKSAEQQSVLMLHRTRELLVRQRTMLVNALRGHCGEFGIVAAQGLSRAGDLIKRIANHVVQFMRAGERSRTIPAAPGGKMRERVRLICGSRRRSRAPAARPRSSEAAAPSDSLLPRRERSRRAARRR